MRWDDKQDDRWDDRWEFARLMYDTQNMLQSYNPTILWNQDTRVWFRNHCKAEAQPNLQSIYIAMWDDKMNETDQDEWDRWDETDRFYQLSQICKNIQISQSYEMKLSITAVCWADW